MRDSSIGRELHFRRVAGDLRLYPPGCQRCAHGFDWHAFFASRKIRDRPLARPADFGWIGKRASLAAIAHQSCPAGCRHAAAGCHADAGILGGIATNPADSRDTATRAGTLPAGPFAAACRCDSASAGKPSHRYTGRRTGRNSHR